MRGFAKITVRHYVVAVENRPGLVSGHLHRHPFRDSCPHHVPDRCPSKIVRDLTRETGSPASPAPRLVVVHDRPAVVNYVELAGPKGCDRGGCRYQSSVRRRRSPTQPSSRSTATRTGSVAGDSTGTGAGHDTMVIDPG